MQLQGIRVTLEVGAIFPSPAPAAVMEKLHGVQVTRTDDGPAGFQLTFRADRARGDTPDFELLSNSLFEPSHRVLIKVSVNGSTKVLMDGIITHQELSHRREFGASTLTVTGEDVSVLMDLVELSLEFPQMGDSAIALLVLGKYGAIGIVPEIVPTPGDLAPNVVERTPQQNATDRAFVRQLAACYGYVFQVSPGPVPLTNTAYFGPPKRFGGSSPPALSVDQGPASNVESVDFRFDALAPTQVLGFVQDNLIEKRLPVAALTSTRIPSLASRPALQLAKVFERRRLFTDPRFGFLKGLACAQGEVDKSTDRVVVGEAVLDTVRYGAVLDVPDVVGVRGVGESYDGEYYVQAVTHEIERGRYVQKATLTREGVGSTVSTVTP